MKYEPGPKYLVLPPLRIWKENGGGKNDENWNEYLDETRKIKRKK